MYYQVNKDKDEGANRVTYLEIDQITTYFIKTWSIVDTHFEVMILMFDKIYLFIAKLLLNN